MDDDQPYVYSSVCYICRKYDKINVKRCSSCKTLAYCSVEHQKLNWPNHKRLCTVIKNLLLTSNKNNIFHVSTPLNLIEWNQFRTGIRQILEDKLGRALKLNENLLWMFPRVCIVCRLTEQNKLFDCNKCLSVSYCSQQHFSNNQVEHEQVCDLLNINFQLANRTHSIDNFTDVNFNCIDKYMTQLPDNMVKFISSCTNVNRTNKLLQIQLSDDLSFILTIIYVMQELHLINHRQIRIDGTELYINVIGADKIEYSLNWTIISQFLFKWITNINKIVFICIGPECVQQTKTFSCNKFNCRVDFVPLTYHKYKQSFTKQQSLLNIAFNCGFHEFDFDSSTNNWIETLPLLIEHNVPIAFTSYTFDEAKQDLSIFLKYQLHLSTHANATAISKLNPFASLKPFRDWQSVQNIFYNNHFLTIFTLK